MVSIICGDKVETGYLYGVLLLNAPFTVPQIKLPSEAQKGFGVLTPLIPNCHDEYTLDLSSFSVPI